LDQVFAEKPLEIKPRKLLRSVREATAKRVSEYQTLLGARREL